MIGHLALQNASRSADSRTVIACFGKCERNGFRSGTSFGREYQDWLKRSSGSGPVRYFGAV